MTVPEFRLQPAEDRRLTAFEFVRDTLRRAILRGDLVGGTRLVQTELAHRLEVSTTPVREAMRDLAADGLISLDSHRSGRVRELDWDDMMEILEVRRSIEPVAVRRAVANITDEKIDRAEALALRLSEEEDLGSWVEMNHQFHFVFHEAVGGSRLAVILKSLEEAAGVYVAQAQRWNPEIRQRANTDHLALIAAYRRRDRVEVLEIQQRHLALPVELVDHAHRS